MKIAAVIISGFFLLALTLAHAARIQPEQIYIEKVCAALGGQWERGYVRTSEGTYPDCETKTKVYEFDFADKHYEGLGQAISYARLTEKQGVLVLIVEKTEDVKFVERAQKNASFVCPRIEVMTVTTEVLHSD